LRQVLAPLAEISFPCSTGGAGYLERKQFRYNPAPPFDQNRLGGGLYLPLLPHNVMIGHGSAIVIALLAGHGNRTRRVRLYYRYPKPSSRCPNGARSASDTRAFSMFILRARRVPGALGGVIGGAFPRHLSGPDFGNGCPILRCGRDHRRHGTSRLAPPSGLLVGVPTISERRYFPRSLIVPLYRRCR